MVRIMTEKDIQAVIDMWYSTPNMALNNVDDTPEGVARFLRRNPGLSFVAEEQGAIVGVILGGHDGRRGYIYHASVLPEYRSHGIGSELAQACINAVRAEGIVKMAVVLFAKNSRGSEFWQRQGFVKRDDLEYQDQFILPALRVIT
ncbi:MAG: GNAT family N-acetyltransferase [Clostridia bacterium]|nr:GNAT family N-acetyltransferase [Clostridia bacterium]MBR5903800.1 GNAT family N-acetyltransferase [Clostridia bacterium]